MNEEDRRRHDKSWNDPPLFTYDQLNEASTGTNKVPLHKRYNHPPVAPEMSPGMGRQTMYGQSPTGPGYPNQQGYGASPAGNQWQQQPQAWQSPVNTGWSQNAPYPSQGQSNLQPGMSPGYGAPQAGQQQSVPPFPLGPTAVPSSPVYPRNAAPVTSVTGSLPGSIPAPGFAPNIIPPSSYAGHGMMNHHPQQPALPPQVGHQQVYSGQQHQGYYNYQQQ